MELAEGAPPCRMFFFLALKAEHLMYLQVVPPQGATGAVVC